MKTPIKQVLLSILLLQTTCQVLPTETAGEQAQTLSATLWQNTKDGLGYLGQQTLNGIEASGRYCGKLALQGAKATGNFAWEQAQERPYLATGIVAVLAVGTYYRQNIKQGIKSTRKAIHKYPLTSVSTGILAGLTLGVLCNEQIKNGLASAYTNTTNWISSYFTEPVAPQLTVAQQVAPAAAVAVNALAAPAVIQTITAPSLSQGIAFDAMRPGSF